MSGDRKALEALAERVENASEADRELDAEIAVTVHPDLGLHKDVCGRWRGGKDGVLVRIADYTSSLDAALTLVPEGWRVYSADWSIPGAFSWTLKGPCTRYVKGPDGYDEAGDDWHVSGSASLPELALVAACLRALASAAPGGGA